MDGYSTTTKGNLKLIIECGGYTFSQATTFTAGKSLDVLISASTIDRYTYPTPTLGGITGRESYC